MWAKMQAWQQRTFTALRHPLYRRYWFAQLLSLMGFWLQSTAQQYLVLELSGGSSSALGWVTVAQFAPSLFISPFAGVMVDRLSRRRILLVAQAVLMLVGLVLAVTTHLGVVSIPLVMGLAFLSGMANAFDMPARQTLVVDFVPREDVPNAVALNSLSFNLSRTVGQALFGMIAALGVTLLAGGVEGGVKHLALPFYVNVASFLYLIYVLATIEIKQAEPGPPSSVLEEMLEGVRYVRQTPAVLYVMLLLGLLSLTILNFNVIVPYFARVIYRTSEAGFGWLSAAFGVGSMLGALVQASKPNPLRYLRVGTVLLVLTPALLALAPNALWAAPVFAACGFSMLTFLISANSTVQLVVPDELRGRVMSLYSFVLIGMGPPGAMIASRLIDKNGPLGAQFGLLALVGLGIGSTLLVWSRLPRTLPPAPTVAGAALD